MFYFLTILIILAAILLILVVLVQRPKGGGLAAQFSSSNLTFGVKRTNDFIEKSTWTLAIVIIVLSMATNFFIDKDVDTGNKAINQEQLENVPSTEPAQPQQQQQPTN